MLIALPICIIWLMCKGDNQEYHDEYQYSFGTLWEDLNTENLSGRMYYLVFMIRRFIFCAVAVNVETIIYQFMINSFLTLAYTFYVAGYRPWKNDFYNKIELAHECVYVLLNYYMILFTEISIDTNR